MRGYLGTDQGAWRRVGRQSRPQKYPGRLREPGIVLEVRAEARPRPVPAHNAVHEHVNRPGIRGGSALPWIAWGRFTGMSALTLRSADHADDLVMLDAPPPDDGVRDIAAFGETWPPFFEWQRSGAPFEIVSLDSPPGGGDDHRLLHAEPPVDGVRLPALDGLALHGGLGLLRGLGDEGAHRREVDVLPQELDRRG